MIKLPKYEARDCATLGTFFRDIYKDNVLFAIQVPVNIAEWAIENQDVFLGNVGSPIEIMRTWELEKDFIQIRHKYKKNVTSQSKKATKK